MSRKIDRFIKELIDDYSLSIDKLKKSELKFVISRLYEANLRELHDDTIMEVYEETFHTYVR